MDPLTLANCRSEITYVVKIKEHDGTDGPTIILDATRINGIDAAWIASGFTEQFYECKKAAQCLRSRLHRLPHVGRYMAGHDTIVSDTNNGVIVATDLDDTKRALLEVNTSKAMSVIAGQSNKLSQQNWSAPMPPLESAFKLRLRLSRLRLDVTSEQKQQRALNTGASEASVLRSLVDDMTKMTFNDLAYYDELIPSATFMIPFGLAATGTTKDMLHTKFEAHPVWLEHLIGVGFPGAT